MGGTPCQAFSVAGLRRSLEDERGNLSLVFVNLMDAIDEERKRLGKPPAICVWENVPGVLSTKDNAFGCFLAGLAGEDVPLQPPGGKWSNAGYVLGPKRAIAWRVLDAQYFGVAQRRRRVFLVASARDGFSPAQVLFESESVRRDNPPSRAKGQGTTYDVAPCIGASGRGFERAGETRGQDPVVAQPYRVANCLTRRMHKGINTTCDEGQTPVLAPQAFYSTESRCDGIPEPGVSPPLKVGSNGGGQPPAVAFKPSHYTRGKDGQPSEVTPPLSADADKGDQDTVVAAPFVKSKRAQSTNDDESWVPGEVAPTFNCFDQGDTRATTVVAYDVHGTLAKKGASETDVHTALRSRSPGQSEASTTTVVAIQERAICENPDAGPDGIGVRTDGVSYTLEARQVPQAVAFTQNSRDEVRQINGDGGRSDAVNVVVPKPMAFAQNQLGEVRTNDEVMGTVNTNQNASGRNTPMVMTPMAVRRLTPRECERLQGFPDDYTAIEYRKKPAADGPRYKALGNSMAVPVMRWIGERIAQCATH